MANKENQHNNTKRMTENERLQAEKKQSIDELKQQQQELENNVQNSNGYLPTEDSIKLVGIKNKIESENQALNKLTQEHNNLSLDCIPDPVKPDINAPSGVKSYDKGNSFINDTNKFIGNLGKGTRRSFKCRGGGK